MKIKSRGKNFTSAFHEIIIREMLFSLQPAKGSGCYCTGRITTEILKRGQRCTCLTLFRYMSVLMLRRNSHLKVKRTSCCF